MVRDSFTILSLIIIQCQSTWIKDLNLPRQLLEYHVSSNTHLRDKCINDPGCKIDLNTTKCFGFEEDCQKENSLSSRSKFTSCDENLNPKVKDKFFEHGDFGYLESRLVKHSICSSSDKESTSLLIKMQSGITIKSKNKFLSSSSLSCSDHLTHCIGRNIYFDFSNLKIKSSSRYRQNVIQAGQVGGNCETFDEHLLNENTKVKGYLMSWADELQHFRSKDDFKINSDHCDVIFERPTIVMKLDAAVNLYHHFCDFINLYASLHLNQTFDQDVDIILWETHPGGYNDHYYGITWKAFSKHEPIELKTLDQKRVCFKNVMMPLLARQWNGLFYNSPVVNGCSGSTLFKTFSQFILHRFA
ncbi:hypothetical protein CRE_04963 [Caenorhabditis remanei]|uniref:Uncharacterized protein n=1 Tax=Caenorhabditis remanei TaxID=31234 RepID=E3MN71_CAERE|nr:hypothetical protein CRE_04963 [Caenorhabditis remanei]